jgi:hypothetical protein
MSGIVEAIWSGDVLQRFGNVGGLDPTSQRIALAGEQPLLVRALYPSRRCYDRDQSVIAG